MIGPLRLLEDIRFLEVWEEETGDPLQYSASHLSPLYSSPTLPSSFENVIFFNPVMCHNSPGSRQIG